MFILSVVFLSKIIKLSVFAFLYDSVWDQVKILNFIHSNISKGEKINEDMERHS